jgi:nitrogen fixation protein FixH
MTITVDGIMQFTAKDMSSGKVVEARFEQRTHFDSAEEAEEEQ